MRVPDFLVGRFYVRGSLRNTASGFALEAYNEMGDGMLVGFGRVAVDGLEIDPGRITADRRDGTSIAAGSISRMSPIAVRRGDSVTVHVAGERLSPGGHRLEVTIVERDLGVLEMAITDPVVDVGADAPTGW